MGVKRPWNIVDMPIYSLATYSGDHVNMNICTYVSAVSMQPKLFMVAVDYNTQTFENLKTSDKVVLQILHEDQQSLVNLLGKNSGKSVDKHERLAKKNLLTDWKGNTVLKGACGYLQMRVTDRANVHGDHEIFYFQVETSSTKREDGILMFQQLIDEGIIL